MKEGVPKWNSRFKDKHIKDILKTRPYDFTVDYINGIVYKFWVLESNRLVFDYTMSEEAYAKAGAKYAGQRLEAQQFQKAIITSSGIWHKALESTADYKKWADTGPSTYTIVDRYNLFMAEKYLLKGK